MEEELIKKLGHSYGKIIKPPTCTSFGYYIYDFLCDNEYFEEKYSNMLLHSCIKTTAEPTCKVA